MLQVKDASLAAVRHAAVAVLLLGALLAGSAGSLVAGNAARAACRCPVPMSCCHSGLCTMDGAHGDGLVLSSCERPSRGGLPVLTLILAIVPARFALATPSNGSNAALFAVLHPTTSPLSSDSPPPRRFLFS